MIRSVLSVFALAAVVATARPVFADPLAATVSDHTQVAAAAEQSALPAPAWSSSSDEAAPTNTGLGKDAIPVGFGWG
jgi:hypothetical protein